MDCTAACSDQKTGKIRFYGFYTFYGFPRRPCRAKPWRWQATHPFFFKSVNKR
jgi:hypothetical protein